MALCPGVHTVMALCPGVHTANAQTMHCVPLKSLVDDSRLPRLENRNRWGTARVEGIGIMFHTNHLVYGVNYLV